MKKMFLGNTRYNNIGHEVNGGFVKIDDETFYKITNFNQMPDFFMTIISHSDHWMFLSSNGSLSAGRKDRDNALFPYYTDDKIHDYAGITGSKTIILVEGEDKRSLWEPFSGELGFVYNIERNLYKSKYGNKIIFEEINHDLGLAFKYGWYSSDKYGFVKKSKVVNLTDTPISISVLDGLCNILPNGSYYDFQNEYSNLLDGYKKNELLDGTNLGLFLLSAIPVDKAEPSESLSATTVWSHGLQNQKTLLSTNQLQNFKYGLEIYTETDIKATRGAYLVNAELTLEQHQSKKWITVSDVNQDTSDVSNLNRFLSSEQQIAELIEEDINLGSTKLLKIVAGADGIQKTNEQLSSSRHYSNTMFNIMRGGTYLDGYNIDSRDFKKYVKQINTGVAANFASFLEQLPEKITKDDLHQLIVQKNNADFIRIFHEYLPLTFSRRHGDPSRPWNLFSIDNKNEDGTTKSDFQGNWRDIFQNWEALCLSYPEYVENIISKFVNASTADGYNPYRIMRSGIDWESPDEEDPWANIGYWCDHQIIYLQKLLEISNDYHPGSLEKLLTEDIFAYANVPYRIKSYEEMILNPTDTIEFDHQLEKQIDDLVVEKGADGRLMMTHEDNVYHVNLTEKILVTLLAKLSNFVPEAGIWLNTQRPEWNDANNALVGNGASVITVCYLRRFLSFWNEKFQSSEIKTIKISEEVKTLFDQVFTLFADNKTVLETGFSDQQRRHFTDTLGKAGTDYRNSIYNNLFTGNKKLIEKEDLIAFTAIALEYIDQTISVNKRDDGLYHAYNLISFKEDSISIRYLYEMLEGQVAVLTSGYLSTIDCRDLLECLKSSQLYVPKHYSYLLYPNRVLPRYIEKNNIPSQRVEDSTLLNQLILDKDTSIITVDDSGHHHFNSDFSNSSYLEKALSVLDSEKYGALVESEKSQCLDIYEEIFDHQSYTGRSGTFYAYEGLGSIYWHMVSKLLLAAEECYFKAVDEHAADDVAGRIKDHYYEIKAGIGIYKSPQLYGAFPTDAYSHTPEHRGAQQPGMTGQVKEDVITRMACLGIRVNSGQITFDSRLVSRNEFMKKDSVFEYFAISGSKKIINLKEQQLAFTLCQVPVVYTNTDHEKIIVNFTNGEQEEIAGSLLNSQISSLIFNRTDDIESLEVSIK